MFEYYVEAGAPSCWENPTILRTEGRGPETRDLRVQRGHGRMTRGHGQTGSSTPATSAGSEYYSFPSTQSPQRKNKVEFTQKAVAKRENLEISFYHFSIFPQ